MTSTSQASDFDYPDLPDHTDNPKMRGDITYSGSFEEQKEALADVWDEDGADMEVARAVMLTNLVRLAWCNYSIKHNN